MRKKEAEKDFITVHWWNFGKKTLDFKGTYKDLFLKKGITSKQIKTGGFIFRMSLGSSLTTFKTQDMDYTQGANEAIKIFFTLLGDKTLIETPRRTYRLNWN